MKAYNIHERRIAVSHEHGAQIFDSLGTRRDQIWPKGRWPALRLTDGKQPGSRGGHGPIRYHVTRHEPGSHLEFQFEDEGLSQGLRGRHFFQLKGDGPGHCIARHVIDAELVGRALLLWPFVIRPLHDALVEDALDNFERAATGELASANSYSPYVRALRLAVAS